LAAGDIKIFEPKLTACFALSGAIQYCNDGLRGQRVQLTERVRDNFWPE
jgi:hypothetical protein